MKKGFYIIFLHVLTNNFVAQILPNQNSILNYNQVLFQIKPVEKIKYYEYNISEDYYFEDKKNFNNKTAFKQIDSTNSTIVDNLRFGAAYKWKVIGYDSSDKLVYESSINTFSVMPCEYCDTKKFKFVQTYNNPDLYDKGIIWCDLYHCAIDRKGNVVWQFPIINKGIEKGRALRDLRMYPSGDLTFITDTNVFCINKDLEIIWKTLHDKKNLIKHYANFHHCLRKLDNNHFMVLQARPYRIKNKLDSLSYDDDYLVEYDERGKEVWSWYSSDHLDRALLKQIAIKSNKSKISLHANSFSFDENGNYIYLNYRDLNRILKINKHTKKIVAQYGQKLCEMDTLVFQTDLFNKQHDVRILPNDEVTMFNNFSKDSNYVSSVLHLKLPQHKTDDFKIIWEFKLNFDTITNGKSERLGSVELLKNGNYLICTGENGRLLEVTKDKIPVWDAMLFEKITNPNKILKFPQYKIAFNSSLYPFNFYVYKTNNFIKLSNEGTETDSYSFFSKKKTHKKQRNKLIEITLKPNECFSLKLDKGLGKHIVIKSNKSNITKEILLEK